MIKRALLSVTAFASLTIAATAGQVLKVSRDANMTTWRAYYGAPFKIEKDGEGVTSDLRVYWHVGRFEVEATFFSNGKLSSFDIEALGGKPPLRLSEALEIADSLRLPSYHMDNGAPTWGEITDDVTAYFEDGDFHFQASQDNDPDPDHLTKDQREELGQKLSQPQK